MLVSYRQHATKPAAALWAITGVLLLYSLGITVVLLTLAAVVVGFGAWQLVRRHHPRPVRRTQINVRRQPNVANR
ncbi:hypothetical protein Prum_049550 [Phytohabitans rumicis]|uniref:Uncharacterized protein n=1 Tax=Phytohabitans rumicis TaxID=1076125 RepID=A0A6V8L1Z9_9ACTN|nr:hypothetical protein Prum_049550 [Phytohabitans rumicis]